MEFGTGGRFAGLISVKVTGVQIGMGGGIGLEFDRVDAIVALVRSEKPRFL